MAKDSEAHIQLSEQDKEELFTDFLLRFSAMDKEDKREGAARNSGAMIGVSNYWYSVRDQQWMYRIFDKYGYKATDGLYNAYLELRKVIPYIIGVRRQLEGKTIRHSFKGYRNTYVMDPVTDQEDAKDIGKRLIDTMLNWLEETTKDCEKEDILE